MAFCKFSTQIVKNNNVSIDPSFITDYLPNAPESCVKIYLYGLLKCTNPDSIDNTLQDFCDNLNFSQDDIISAFYYWQDMNLVQVLNVNPLEVRYLPIKNSLGVLKKFKIDKYASFNMAVQELIDGRMITPNEYNEYYSIIETYNMEPDALIMIIKYCIDYKGASVGYPYIVTVAKNWAMSDNIHTTAQVEEKLSSLSSIQTNLSEIAKTVGYKGNVTLEHRNNYLKWTKEYGFEHGVIVYVAKSLKKTGSNGLDKLDKLITKYYEMGLFSSKEIEEYQSNKDYLNDLSKKILAKLGIINYSFDTFIDMYLLNWIKKGYQGDTLIDLATYCNRQDKRSLESLDGTVNKLYKLGLISSEGITKYIQDIVTTDNKIKELIDNLGLNRKVNKYDRDLYKTWTESWGFGDDVITYAGSLSYDKSNPIQYINRLLSNWHNEGISSLDQAKKSPKETSKTTTNTVTVKSYSQDDLSALFDNLDEVDL